MVHRARRWLARVLAGAAARLGGAEMAGAIEVEGTGGAGEAQSSVTVNLAVADHEAGPTFIDFLDHIARMLDAARVVLWRVDRTYDRVIPLAATADRPDMVTARGSPLAWCAEQNQPLTVDPRPLWARADVVALPIPVAGDALLLTVESEAHVEPLSALGDGVARLVHGLLLVHARIEAGAEELDRGRRLAAFLHHLPTAGDSRPFPDALARAVVALLEQDGGLVAAWPAEPVGADGRVVAVAGRGRVPAPRPEPGDEVHPGSHLELARRAGATLPRDTGMPPLHLVRPDERWAGGRPRHTTVVPLVDTLGRPTGALAAWGSARPDPGAIALLEGIAPLLAVQLEQALDLERFRERVDRDPLTGLADRGALEDRMRLEFDRYDRYRRPVALLVLDLDHFKAVNDTYGHEAGDAVLQRTADILRAGTRQPDLPARFGGEEMVVVLPETSLHHALEVAERIRAGIADAVVAHGGAEIRCTASIGVSACPECVDDPRSLMRIADDALYQAKREGRNRVVAAARVEGDGSGGSPGAGAQGG
jgi:diguanylate cyclase (GGDEF)-like protein